MTSPLPPRRRDTRDLADLVRQQQTNLTQLDPGLMRGRFSPAKPVTASPEADDESDDDSESEYVRFLNTDTIIAGPGNVPFRLTQLPEDGSEHVFWHPKGHGGIHIPRSAWSRVDQLLTIPAFDGQGARDLYTCEYAYYPGEVPILPTPLVVGFTTPGTWDSGTATLSYAMPAGTVAGDLLHLTMRGAVAPGGGEVVDGLACADPRMALAYTAVSLNSGHAIMAATWIGIADGSGSPVVIGVPAGTVDPGKGVLTSITGANGWGTVNAIESGGATPVVPGVAAVASTWIRGASFTTITATPPDGYTNISSTGAAYASTDTSFWYDPDETSSPSGSFVGEGCCVIAII